MDKKTPVGIDAGIVETNMSTRTFLSTGIKSLIGLTAANATGVLGQTLPRTYDEIMVALAEGKLTYQELFDTCSQNANNFNETQKIALKGELAKLKLKAQESLDKRPQLNESSEARKARLEEERLLKLKPKLTDTFNKTSLNSSLWSNGQGDDLDGKVTVDNVAKKLIFKLPGGKLKGRAEFTPQLVSGNYILQLQIEGGDLIVWFKDGNGNSTRKVLASGKHQISGEFRFGVALTKKQNQIIISEMKLIEDEAKIAVTE